MNGHVLVLGVGGAANARAVNEPVHAARVHPGQVADAQEALLQRWGADVEPTDAVAVRGQDRGQQLVSGGEGVGRPEELPLDDRLVFTEPRIVGTRLPEDLFHLRDDLLVAAVGVVVDAVLHRQRVGQEEGHEDAIGVGVQDPRQNAEVAGPEQRVPVPQSPGVLQLSQRAVDQPVLVDGVHAQGLALERRVDRQAPHAGVRRLALHGYREPQQAGCHGDDVRHAVAEVGRFNDDGGVGGESRLQRCGRTAEVITDLLTDDGLQDQVAFEPHPRLTQRDRGIGGGDDAPLVVRRAPPVYRVVGDLTGERRQSPQPFAVRGDDVHVSVEQQ